MILHNNIPDSWCNFLYDYPEFIDSNTPITQEQLRARGKQINISPKQPLTLMRQSINIDDKYILIPDELLAIYETYRPTPLKQAKNLQRKLDCNANIFYKFEGANATGSHKLNTALAQAYYYKRAGAKHIVTGTGAGQWGAAIAYACRIFGLQCTVFMVDSSLKQKPSRGAVIKALGATIYNSPSPHTNIGRSIIENKNGHPGSLSIATAEAIEVSNSSKEMQFAVGSGENSVLLHQTIIGEEALMQLKLMNIFPDKVYACIGAGSNFAGIAMPIHRYANESGLNCDLIAVEPNACPKLTRGRLAYEINDFSGTTPISRMYTLGKNFIAPEIHAGGLRYHGTSEFLSAMYEKKLFLAERIGQVESLTAGWLFYESEGVLPAPESAHAIGVAIKHAKMHPKNLKPLNLLINVSGHGMHDMSAYEMLNNGVINDPSLSEDEINEYLKLVENNWRDVS